MARTRGRVARGQELLTMGWWPAIVLMLVALVDRIETGVVAGVLPLLQEEWGFSDTAAGAIPTAITIAGILVILPSGYLADRTVRRTLIAGMVACWSLIITGSALAPSFAVFFLTRVALGVADNVDTPSAMSLMGDYYGSDRRARALGYQRMCYLIGGFFGTQLGGILGDIFGWRAAFFFMVIPGLIVAWIVWRLPEPERGAIDRFAAKTPDEETQAAKETVVAAQTALSGKAVSQIKADLRDLMAVRTIRYVYVGIMMLFMGIAAIFFWLPTYINRTFDTGTGLAGSLTAIVGVVGVVGGTIIGGTMSDRWHGSVRGARVLIGGWSLLIGSVIFGIAFSIPSLAAQVLILTVSVLIMALASPNVTAAIADVIPANQRGIAFALVNLLIAGGGAFGPLGIGAVSDRVDSLAVPFQLLVIPMILGSIVVILGRRTFEEDVQRMLARAAGDSGS